MFKGVHNEGSNQCNVIIFIILYIEKMLDKKEIKIKLLYMIFTSN